MNDAHQLQRRALAISLLASLLLWNLPAGGLVLYPFKLLATWIHEMSHGLAMIATGAGFSHLEIYRDTSGIAYATGGATRLGRATIASAGYMGTAAVGGVLLVLGQTKRGARGVLAAFAVLLALTAALWIRNDFGTWVAVAAASALTAAAIFCRASAATFIVNFIAAQACIHAVLDIRVLFHPNLVVGGEVVRNSDAHNMAAATFGQPWMWAVVWLLWSFAVFFVALRVAYMRQVGPMGAGREPPRDLGDPGDPKTA
jgi:hypothetical protein